MKTKILNLFSNVSVDDTKFKGGHGQSFLITIGDEKILYDTGLNSETLLHNMGALNVSADDITKLVLSHGHFDHTGGIPGLLNKRTSNNNLPLIAHPDFSESKIYKLFKIIKKNIGSPEITEEQMSKVNIQLTNEPVELAPNLKTTGEITDRSQILSIEHKALHRENGKYVVDPIKDDVSLVLSTEDGEVIISGCAHAGILNICEYVKKTTGNKIRAIIGGTHMVRFSEDEVKHVASKFVSDYDNPDLYLNHCTDYLPDPFGKKTKATVILRKELGDKVKDCFVGTELEF